MGIVQVGGKTRFLTEVEDWMRDQWSTEVFNFSASPYTEHEMAITRILDGILYEVVFGIAGIDEMVDRARIQPNRLIRGRRAVKGEQHLSTWMGNTIDSMFKDRFVRERDSGSLKSYKGCLDFVPPGVARSGHLHERHADDRLGRHNAGRNREACPARLDPETLRSLLSADLGRASDQTARAPPRTSARVTSLEVSPVGHPQWR